MYLGNMHTLRSHWVVREDDVLFDKKEGNYLHNRCLRSLRKGMLSAKMLQAKFITAAVSGGLTKLVLMVRMDRVWPALETHFSIRLWPADDSQEWKGKSPTTEAE